MHLRKSHKIGVSVYTKVADLPTGWDGVLQADHPLHSSILAVYEAVQLPDISSYYTIYGDPAKPVAIACFQMLKVRPRHLNTSLLQGFQALLIPRVLGLLKPSLLVAGHLFRHDIVSFHAQAGMSTIDAFRAYEQMIAAAGAQSCAVAILVKDVPQNLVPYFQNYAPQYMQLRNDISMQLQVPGEWRSFDDYAAALKHKYAQKLRKVRGSLAAVRIQELDMEAVDMQASKIHELYLQVSKHQVFSMGMLNERFLPELKRFYGDRLKIWAFYEGETMVAFASAWLHDAAFDMFYIGFDYERNAELNLYFNILYFSIEQAIAQRKPLLILGRTALEAKARLGCIPHYLSTFLNVRSPYLRRLVAGKINNQHQQEGAWEERHPMKEK
jgi:hypothetical protein